MHQMYRKRTNQP